jgi:amino acid adenylation domain-containing protein
MSEPVGFELSVQQRLRVRSGRPSDAVVVFADVPVGLIEEHIQARLDAAVARHEVLRSTLRRAPGLDLPLQFVHDELPVGWLPAASAAAGTGADVEHVVQRQAAILDPAAGPVIAASVLESGNGRVLLLSALTAVADAATLELIAADALQLTAAADAADEDPIQYPEYVAWQQERLDDAAGDDNENAATAWRRLTGDAPPVVLTGAAPVATEEFGFAVVADAGDSDIDRWLTAWAVTLARLTGNDSVLFGVELDPRSDPELSGAAGPYARLVPFAVTLPASGSFDELVEAVRRDRALALTWFEWAPTDQESTLCNVFSVGSVASRTHRDNVQLELRVAPGDVAARVVVGPRGSLALAERVALALANVMGTSTGELAAADVLTADDVALLVGDAPEPTSTVPVIAEILQQAASNPGRLALTDGVVEVTYGELADRVNALAATLLSAGANASAPVATYLPRSTDLIVSMLAAQRAGSGYLPLDIDQPPARLLQQLQIAGTTVVIADGPGPLGFEGTVVPIGGAADSRVQLRPPAAESLSYLIFTSGSTGVPKGVAVPESALANYVGAIRALVTETAGDRPLNWALVTSPTTDLGNTAVFPALASGGTLHVVPFEVTQEPGAFARYVSKHSVDVLKITPSHLEALLVDETAQILPKEILFIGGEALGWPLVQRVAGRGSCRVVNHYGPTETTVGALVNLLDPAAPMVGPTVQIGRALAGDEAFVLDSRGRLAPVGAVGELAIGGAGVARGYWSDDARTRERFVDHPYRSGERLYLTGDLARLDADGKVCFLGRRDGQVKIRGFRIERGEIEAALLAHPGVQRAAVVVRGDVGPEPALVGYVVSQVNPRPTEAALRSYLLGLLPGYMVPMRLVQLDAFPLRPNGKLDEPALPAPAASISLDRVRPVGPTESTIAAIFAEVLGIDDVGVTDDFFELGGHSLLATRIVVSVRSALDVQLPVYALFETPTVRGRRGLRRRARPDERRARRHVGRRSGRAARRGVRWRFPRRRSARAPMRRQWGIDDIS